ncbi:MAG: adenylate/guanylate cyclase domain-containing protein [Proteobacteria bacterium]|nr:adenylate/guanylate cyclase domain-containing protein [Pseudomonadota bacterium]
MGSIEAWIVFAVTFLTSAISLSMTFLSRQDLHVLRSIAEGPSGKDTYEIAPDDLGDDQVYRTDGDTPAGAEALPLAGDPLETPDDVEQSIAVLIDDPSGLGPEERRAEGAPETANMAAPNQDGPFNAEADFYGTDSAGDDAFWDDDPEEEQESLEQAAARRKATVSLMTFMEKSLTRFTELEFRLGAGDRFGSNLFITGACEAMYHMHGLTHQQFLDMLETALAATGNGRDVARRLAERYDEYLLEPQYIGIFQAGSDAILKFAAGDEEAAGSYAAAIKEWRNPRTRENRYEGPVTVLFTDIVGSTKSTQELGDEGAQVIVRAHNSIVRKALSAHGGAEIKHTGDGIMATFTKSASAVEGAIEMIEGLEEHNKATPDLPLHIRIGLNAGEPILEDNDIFGSTVQMAARICDAAESDQILVSMVVREMCGGKKLKFEEAGRFAMKGIEEPVTLYDPRPPVPEAAPAQAAAN